MQEVCFVCCAGGIPCVLCRRYILCVVQEVLSTGVRCGGARGEVQRGPVQRRHHDHQARHLHLRGGDRRHAFCEWNAAPGLSLLSVVGERGELCPSQCLRQCHFGGKKHKMLENAHSAGSLGAFKNFLLIFHSLYTDCYYYYYYYYYYCYIIIIYFTYIHTNFTHTELGRDIFKSLCVKIVVYKNTPSTKAERESNTYRYTQKQRQHQTKIGGGGGVSESGWHRLIVLHRNTT